MYFSVKMWPIICHVLASDQPPPVSSNRRRKLPVLPPHQGLQHLGISLPPSPLKPRAKSGTQEGHGEQSVADGRSNPSGLDIQAQVREWRCVKPGPLAAISSKVGGSFIERWGWRVKVQPSGPVSLDLDCVSSEEPGLLVC